MQRYRIDWQLLLNYSDWYKFVSDQYQSPRNNKYARISWIVFIGMLVGSCVIGAIYNNFWVTLPTIASGAWLAFTFAAKSSKSYNAPREYPCWSARINDEIISLTIDDVMPILYESEGWKA